MVMYRFPKHHKPKPIEKSKKIEKPKQEEVVIEDKPIEIKNINGKKIEIYKYRL